MLAMKRSFVSHNMITLLTNMVLKFIYCIKGVN